MEQKFIKLDEVVQMYKDKMNNIQDAEFEIIAPPNCVFDVKKIEDQMKRIGALEDIECEIGELPLT